MSLKTVEINKGLATKNKSLMKTQSRELIEMQQQRKAVSAKVKNSTELEVRALTDITAFAELIKFQGGWENFGEFHKELAEFITRPQVDDVCREALLYQGDEYLACLRRMVLVPRGHLKSTIGTVLYTLWRVYRNPEIRILVGCNLPKLSVSFIRELRSYFEHKDLQNVWNRRPHIKGNLIPEIRKKSNARNFNRDETEAEDRKIIWNQDALQVVREGQYKEPTIFATSVGTTVTGMHFDLVILDDLVDFKNVESLTKKEHVEEWIADIESVLNPPQLTQIDNGEGFVINDILGGEVLINGTRYAVDDYYGKVIKEQAELGYHIYSRNIYKNGKDDTDGYLWHERYNDAIVKSLQARLSPRRFSSQYLNTVYEKDAYLFNLDAVRVVPNDCVFSSSGDLIIQLPNGRREVLNTIIAIDPAFSTSAKSDDCAIIAGAKMTDGDLVVLDAYVDRMNATEVIAKVQEFTRKYQTLRVYYEANGVGMLVPELFKPQSSYVDGKPIITYGHYEQRPKESKIQGVLELPVNTGKVIVLQRVRDQERLWQQFHNYPAVRHDDFLDGLVTLYEKSIPSRKLVRDAYIKTTEPTYLKVLSTNTQEKEGYLERYNSVRLYGS